MSVGKKTGGKSFSTGSCPRSLAPNPSCLISAPHTHLFSFSSITSHLLSVSQSPLSELPAYYVSSMWAARKSLERSKPFIRYNLICFQQDSPFQHEGTFVGKRLCQIVIAVVQKCYFYRNLLPEMSFFFLLEQKGGSTSQGLWADCYIPPSYFPLRMLSLQMVLYIRSHWTQHVIICCSVSVSHGCTRLFDKSESVRLYQSESSHLINLPRSILNWHCLFTKQSHTPIGNEVPRGHTYIKTRIIILLHAMITPSIYLYSLLWALARMTSCHEVKKSVFSYNFPICFSVLLDLEYVWMAICMCGEMCLLQCEMLFKKMSRISGIASRLCKDNSCRVIAPSNSFYSADHSANFTPTPRKCPVWPRTLAFNHCSGFRTLSPADTPNIAGLYLLLSLSRREEWDSVLFCSNHLISRWECCLSRP